MRIARVRARHSVVRLSTVSVLFFALGLSACSRSPGPDDALAKYLADWSTAWTSGSQAPGDSAGTTAAYKAMRALVSKPPADFVAVNQQVSGALDVQSVQRRVLSVSTSGSVADASVSSRYVLRALGPWTVRSELRLSESSGHWLVDWTPRSIIPSLGTGDRVAENVVWPRRADILGANGTTLTADQPMVTVGVEGSRMSNQAALAAALEQAGATPTQVSAALSTATAHPQWFVPVVEISQALYEQLKPTIYPVPGTAFESHGTRSAVTPGLASHVVGSLGAITAQELRALGPPYRASDSIGQTGIEQAFERRLAGRPGGSITVVDSSGQTLSTVATFAQHLGASVQTTIDPAVQQAAEAALGGVNSPAALVAIQASTGAVLASVSLPGSDAFDKALGGSYPPGSSFKVVTAADLIEHGLTPSSPASCPPQITVGGATFHNFEGETHASLTLSQAFAESCNAAFIGLAGNLDYPSLPSTAAQFGIGSNFQMGLRSFAGSVPTPSSASSRAATAIGQGNVVVAPLDMAVVAASVDSGSLRLPRLVAGSPDDSAPAKPLDPPVVSDLQQMMGAVVTSPNGTAARAGLPPGTYGKTGTAEFGSANPPQTHAWFIGYRGDLAFAVLVVGGGVGGVVAAPIAATFLNAVTGYR